MIRALKIIILRGLVVVQCMLLGLATPVTATTLGLIIYHRHRFKQHHIFAFNIILADFIAAVCLDMYYIAGFLDLYPDSVMYYKTCFF